MKKTSRILICQFIVIGIVLIFSNSCKKEKLLKIGDNYQGGIIFYILQSGDPGYDAEEQHGLIAAPSDQYSTHPGMQWHDGIAATLTVTGATATSLGTGNSNTNTIVNIEGTGNYPAKLCYDLELGGYNDWYLPSKDELNKLYINRDAVGGFVGTGTIWTYGYWSSSEKDKNYAWGQLFPGNGTQASYNKVSQKCYVRAVRSF